MSYRAKVHRQATKKLKSLDRITLLGNWSPRPKTILWDETIPANRHPRVGASPAYRMNEAGKTLGPDQGGNPGA